MTEPTDNLEVFESREGVKLFLSTPSRTLQYDISKSYQDAHPKPQPPMVDLGKGRDEPNEADPKYAEQLALWNAEGILQVLNAYLIFGVKGFEKPDEMPGPDDELFSEMLEAANIAPETSTLRRRAQWIDKMAIPNEDDKAQLMAVLSRRAGVPEIDVSEASEALFRRVEEQPAHSTAQPQ